MSAIEMIEPGHRAVVAHDLAQNAARVSPGHRRQVDGCLGVPGSFQNAARPSA